MKKHVKKLTAMMLAVLMVFAMTACSPAPQESAAPAEEATENVAQAEAAVPDKVVKIMYGNTTTDSHPLTWGMNKFDEVLEEVSGGHFVVDVFPNNELGSYTAALADLQVGNIQMYGASTSGLANFTDLGVILGLPFLFPSREIAFKFMDGEYGQEFIQQVREETGIQIIGIEENGSRQFTNSKKAITSPADMKGLKFRVMENPIYIKTFEAFGATATPMAFSELYVALQQGTVDGQDNPFNTIVDQGFYEVNPYITKSDYLFDFSLIYMNGEFWDNLTDQERAWVEEAVAAQIETSRGGAVEKELENLAICKEKAEVVELTAEQRALFQEAVQPVYDWYAAEYDDAERLAEWQAEIARLAAE